MAPGKETKTTQAFEITDDMKTYIAMAETAGVKYDLATSTGRAHFNKKYDKWVEAGRPKPKLDIEVAEDEALPIKLYREKVRGKQKLYYRDSKGVMHGKTVESKEVEKKDSAGNPYMQKTDKTTYAEYNEEMAKELVQKSTDADRPQYYFVDGTLKYWVKREDFTKDFDEIMKLIKERKYIN